MLRHTHVINVTHFQKVGGECVYGTCRSCQQPRSRHAHRRVCFTPLTPSTHFLDQERNPECLRVKSRYKVVVARRSVAASSPLLREWKMRTVRSSTRTCALNLNKRPHRRQHLILYLECLVLCEFHTSNSAHIT
jgi:hypothetical protein